MHYFWWQHLLAYDVQDFASHCRATLSWLREGDEMNKHSIFCSKTITKLWCLVLKGSFLGSGKCKLPQRKIIKHKASSTNQVSDNLQCMHIVHASYRRAGSCFTHYPISLQSHSHSENTSKYRVPFRSSDAAQNEPASSSLTAWGKILVSEASIAVR